MSVRKFSPALVASLNRELLAYNLVLAALLGALFVFNVFTAQPALGPSTLLPYALLSLLLAITFLLRTRQRVGSEHLGKMATSFFLQLMMVFALAFILQGRAKPYFYLIAFDGYIAIHSVTGKRAGALAYAAGVLALAGLSAAGWELGDLLWYGVIVFAAEFLHHQWNQRVQLDSLLAELAQAHHQLQDFTAQAEALAVSRERARLAHEIHDTVGHTLAALNVQIELLAWLPADQSAAREQAAEQARALVRTGQADVWRAVQALRPAALESLSLVEAIAELVNDFGKTLQVRADWQIVGERRPLPPRYVLLLYRAAQEALTNIQRHAPDAGQAAVRLRYAPEAVTLTVENTPPSLPSPLGRGVGGEGGHGLRGLRERAESLGGIFHAASDAVDGFRLEMSLPVTSEQ